MSKIWQLQTNDMVGKASMAEAFPFLCSKTGIISFVGAGGKTSLMYFLAKMVCDFGKKVIVTTTTHIENPGEPYYAENLGILRDKLDNVSVAVTGHRTIGGKLSALSEEELGELESFTDFLLIEADGSKHLPCKVPNEKEPVIYANTDVIIGIMGLDSIGKPLRQVCFRIEETKALLHTDENHIMTVEDAVKILLSPLGTSKGVGNHPFYIVLNKCDNEDRMQIGTNILKQLTMGGRVDKKHCCLTCLQERSDGDDTNNK